jgi:hypothetical protein
MTVFAIPSGTIEVLRDAVVQAIDWRDWKCSDVHVFIT